ncbi:MAG TPA: pyridoxal-dependent decarboxylase [Pyrinomonadaceae bacterium]|nr:pyridoxal-dependent decarboxylase [Pyrinomonadaceae bacterium]
MEREKPGLAPPIGDMPSAEFRRFGHELIDWIAEYFEHIDELPVLSQIAPGDLKAQLPEAPPQIGESMSEIIPDIDKLIVPALTHWSHPSFFAYFATSTSAPGIFGELLAAAFDNKAMLWRTSPASTELEEVTLDWLRQMMGLDPGYSGIIYDTASVSSMHAIAAAREGVEKRIREEGMSGRGDLPLMRVYVSEQAHSSIEKGVITLGLGQRGLRKIPVDAQYRMDPAALAAAIDEDKRNGAIPFCIVATVGTTSTSSIDPVPEIVPIGEKHAMWLHVDAAYAGSAAIVPELRHILNGCERADSVAVNPHKWLFTPFDLSVLYCRHMDLLRRAFSLVPEYLRTPEQEKVRSGSDYGVQLGRRFRALKLWMVIRYFGHEGLAARIREHCRLAKLFASWVEEDAAHWELLSPVPLGLVCFRACPETTGTSNEDRSNRLDKLNEQLLHEVNASGKAFLSHTRLQEKLTLRLSIGNIRTTEEHVRRVWGLLNSELRRLMS